MKNRPKLAVAGAVFSGCVAGIYQFAIRKIFQLACNGRKKPKDSDQELPPLAKEGQEWLHQKDHDIRILETEDGLRLVGHYIPCENAVCTVIEFHGWHGSWDSDFSASSPFLHELGCNLLLVEQRGQGASQGRYMSMGLLERRDVSAWVRYYQEQIDDQVPIILAGLSMGAATVLMASAESYPPQVKGILADCGFSSAYDILKTVGKKWFHLPEHPFCDSINLQFKKTFGEELKGWTAIDAVEQATLPILFVHGTADDFVPYPMSVAVYEACTTRKELFLVEGAAHGMSFLVDREGYIRKFREFFDI